MKLINKIVNLFLRFRFWFYRIFFKGKLKNYSMEEKENYVLTFYDYFNEESWDYDDTKKWRVGGSHMYHPSRLNVYYGPPELRKNGLAAFFSRYNPMDIYVYQLDQTITFPFETSRINTRDIFNQKYGRFECRMTLPNQHHSWPAFWMWGRPWPPEIDIIEAYGKETGEDAVYQEINLHYGEQSNPKQMGVYKIKIDSPKNLESNFYEFALEWTPNKLDFYTNGVKIFQYKDKNVLKKWFNQEMWLVVNNSIKDYNKHDPEYYSEFLVDYVRAYKFKKEKK